MNQKLFLIHPATFKLDGGAMFGIIPKPLWSSKIKPDDLNRIAMSLRVVLLQKNGRNILIDTGIGSYHPEQFNQMFDVKISGSNLAAILDENLKLKAEDITDIVLTHLHFDHAGGLELFPNATLHLHKDHFQYAQKPTLRDSGSFLTQYFMPLISEYDKRNQIHWVDGHDGDLIEGILKFKTSFGHTPYMIHPYNDQFIYMADLVPMSHHIHVPWVMGYDMAPGITTEYKQKFYDFIMKNNLVMIFEHDLDFWGARLKINEKKAYAAKELHTSNKNIIEEITNYLSSPPPPPSDPMKNL